MTKPADLRAILAISASIYLFLGLTGTLTSGFHFTDDHEILDIVGQLATKSWAEVIKEVIAVDLSIRFRPMYYVHRVVECEAFKDNLLLWSLYNGFLASATFALCYLGLRRLAFSIAESLAFLVVAFVGTQMAIWWQLGPAETIGIFFLSLAFYLSTRTTALQGLGNTLLFSVFLILSSWSKESFTLVVPAFLFLKVWLRSKSSGGRAMECLKKEWALGIPLAVAIGNVAIIVSRVGTAKLGNAGVDPVLGATVLGMFKIVASEFKLLLLLMLSMWILLRLHFGGRRKTVTALSHLTPAAVFATLVVLPNWILYAKSGMGGRYLLPAMLGFAFLIAHAVRGSRSLGRLHTVFLVGVAVVGVLQLGLAARAALAFAKEGAETRKFLATLTENTASKGARVLLVADPASSYEWSISLDTYLSKATHCRLYVREIGGETASSSQAWYSRLIRGAAQRVRTMQSGLAGNPGEYEAKLSAKWRLHFSGRQLSDMVGAADVIAFLDATLVDKAAGDGTLGLDRYRRLSLGQSRFAVLARQ
jgi:hypothetical protein